MTLPDDMRAHLDELRALHELAGKTVARDAFHILITRGQGPGNEAFDEAMDGSIRGLREAAGEALRRHQLLSEELVELYLDVAERAFRTEFARLVCAWHGDGGSA